MARFSLVTTATSNTETSFEPMPDRQTLLFVAATTDAAFTARARDALADRRIFPLGDAAWIAFQTILDRPVQHKPALARLFAEPSIFAEEGK